MKHYASPKFWALYEALPADIRALAHWVNEHGASRKRKFSVLRHGERQAKRLAIAERERQLNLVCAIKAGRS